MKKLLFTIIISSLLIPSVLLSEPIKIGGIYTLSGFGAAGGEAELNGTRLAVEEINSSGGVNGRKLKLIIEDCQSDFGKTAAAFKKLVEIDQIDLLLGPNWAEFSEIAAPLAEAKKKLMITASGYTDDLVKDRNFVFTLMPPHHLSIKPFSDYIGKLSPKRVALIVSQNAYYETIARGLKDNLARDDIEIWKESSLPPEEKDFRSLISHLKIKEVDLVIAFLLEGGPLASFLRQSKEQKLDAQILSGPGPAYDDVILKDLQLAEGLIHFDYYDPSTKEFRAKYKKRFGVDSKIGSGRSYDSVYLAKEAIERCGLEPIPLQRCILNSSYKGVTGPISFDKDGGIVGSTEIVKLYKGINGRFIEVN